MAAGSNDHSGWNSDTTDERTPRIPHTMEFTEKLLGDGETTANRATDEKAASREQTGGTGAAGDDAAETTESSTNGGARGDTFAFRDGDVAADSAEAATKNDGKQRNGDSSPRHDVAADLGTGDSGQARRDKPGRSDGVPGPQDDVAADLGMDETAATGADTTADAQRTDTTDAPSDAAETEANDTSGDGAGADSVTGAATPTNNDSNPGSNGTTSDRTRTDAGSTSEDVAAPMDGRILHIAAAQSITVTDGHTVRIDGIRDVSLAAEPETDAQNEHATETPDTVGSRT
ncbi:hypothetical protein [Halococcus saccharolyticus]|uniref:Uncharacterized protein n=1 Tax=Halococcus saccharolyticus DSM 5350 TaxID=1227455 RepID=M0MHB8_9EURY|nr:hypothetical protein [Halococcus saccharolyticus]EMA44079.1 hypothetical protein C449_11153 [Halococcus saccharolyticus DSM 5350]